MPRKCSICTHPKRAHINRALVAGKRSFRNIAEQYGVSATALSYHKKHHLTKAIEAARKSGEIHEGKTAFEQFSTLMEEAEKQYKEAKGAERVAWFRELRNLLEMAFKLGIEAARQRERRVFKDVTPAIERVIEKELGL